MDVSAGLYVYDVVVKKSSDSLSDLVMSSCTFLVLAYQCLLSYVCIDFEVQNVELSD